MVSIIAFQAIDLGSIPDGRILFLPFLDTPLPCPSPSSQCMPFLGSRPPSQDASTRAPTASMTISNDCRTMRLQTRERTTPCTKARARLSRSCSSSLRRSRPQVPATPQSRPSCTMPPAVGLPRVAAAMFSATHRTVLFRQRSFAGPLVCCALTDDRHCRCVM